MNTKLLYCTMMFDDLRKSVDKYIKNSQAAANSYCSANYMNRNNGKVALKRKITMLRQELLNLERMLDGAEAY